MKYIAFWEFDPEHLRSLIEKFMKSKVGLKLLFEPHGIGGQNKGFTIFETDSAEDILNYVAYYSPELRFKIFPITSSMDASKKWLEYHP